jgi:hypothetical protein
MDTIVSPAGEHDIIPAATGDLIGTAAERMRSPCVMPTTLSL